MLDLCEIQMDSGRQFVLEYPNTKALRNLPKLHKLRNKPGMREVKINQDKGGAKRSSVEEDLDK